VYPGDRELLDRVMHGSGVHCWAFDIVTQEVELAGASHERTGMPLRFPADLGAAYIHAEDRPALQAEIAKALAGAETFVSDHRFIHPITGAHAWYRERGMVIRDAAGTPIRIIGISHDITELKLSERLRELSAQLVVADDVAAVYERVLDVAIAMLRSDGAALQLYVQERDALELLAARGLPSSMLERWHWTERTATTVSAETFRELARIGIRDLATQGDRFAGVLEYGIHAVQATPLVSRSGELVGVLSTQWRTPHEASARELELFDALARQATDLIERSRDAARLRESEARYRTLFESLDDGFYLVEVDCDADGRCIDARYLAENPAAIEMSGLELVGKSLRSTLPDANELWYAVATRVLATGVAERVEIDEGNRWYEARVFRPEPEAPHSRRVAIVWRDATERRRSAARDEFLLKLSDALRPHADTLDIQASALRLLGERLNASRVVYAWILGDGNACEVVVNYRADGVPSVVGMHVLGDYMRERLRAGTTMVVPDTGLVADNLAEERAAHRRSRILAHVTVPLVKGGRLISFMSAHSERVRAWTSDEVALVERTAEQTWAAVERAMAEAEVRRARDQLELRVAERTDELARANAELRDEMTERQKLQRQLATAQEAERRRVARDLHDQTGQLLAGLAIAVRSIATAPEKLSDLRSIADELAAQVHALAVQLRPTALDDLGLVPALRQLIDGWAARVGVPVDFETATLAERLPPEVETVLYRVVQEALTNTYKHADATAVSVICSSLDGVASAIVEDNGCGFDPNAMPKDRIGLLGMRERVELAGGELVVESGPNRGTTVIARIPLRE
jgi:signal transduction histidine kinase/PAS domain-containing protein